MVNNEFVVKKVLFFVVILVLEKEYVNKKLVVYIFSGRNLLLIVDVDLQVEISSKEMLVENLILLIFFNGVRVILVKFVGEE